MNSVLDDVADRDVFERERQALARLNHPNIAQLFDGGVDETGCPFLIMELVDGQPLERYAIERRLPVRQIVQLVVAVCDAVQHAHQHLVVHGNLTSSNILVDAAGTPRIVDFGVARTSGAPPTIQDDVHSLGVILRELAANAPHTDADFSTIMTLACEPDLAGRYSSAQQLADDLRAWLDHRPLASKRRQGAYVAGKFLRRNRLATTVAGIVAIALTASVIASTTLYIRADGDRAQAEHRFADVRSLSKYLLYDVYDRLEKTPLTLGMRLDVASNAQGYLTQLAETTSAPVDVKREVIEGLVRLAALQAGRRQSNLGRAADAKANLDRAETLSDNIAKTGAQTTEDRLREIRVSLMRASIAMNADQALDEAGKFLAKAQDSIGRLPAPGAPPELAIEASLDATDLASWLGHYEDALKYANATLALIAGLPIEKQETDELRDADIRVRTLKGDALYWVGQEPEAVVAYGENVERANAWFAAHPESMLARRHAIVAHWNLGSTIMEHDAAGALKHLETAAAMLPPLMAFEPADENAQRAETVVLLARAQALAASGRHEEGLKAIQSQVDNRRARMDANPGTPEYARAYVLILTAKGDMQAENKQRDSACATYAEADRILTGLQHQNRVSDFDAANGAQAQLRQSQQKYCGGGR